MTCKISAGAIVCSSGPYRPALSIYCPWCDELRRVLIASVFGGWCGHDVICGTCGSSWSTDGERIHKISEEQREKNVERVASVPDPKCWDCCDSGYPEPSPLDEEMHICGCPAGIRVSAAREDA